MPKFAFAGEADSAIIENNPPCHNHWLLYQILDESLPEFCWAIFWIRWTPSCRLTSQRKLGEMALLYAPWKESVDCWLVEMAYCPECSSDDVQDVKKGNKRYYTCEVCGNEWSVEERDFHMQHAHQTEQGKKNPSFANARF
jgi:hypothetical protein